MEELLRMEQIRNQMNYSQHWFALWELTKRELKRKYSRSYLGIMWSSIYPLMRMALVVFLFSYVFNKGIAKYPAYFFVAFLTFEFFANATQTALTTLQDNRNLVVQSKLPRELFVLSRVLTAFVNFLLGCIPFLAVLAWYRTKPTVYLVGVPFVLFFLVLFATGVAYITSIWYVFQRDAKNIFSNVIYIWRFFVAMFYSVDQVSDGVAWFIMHNPMYAYIKVLREFIVYGQGVDRSYLIRAVCWGTGTYVVGRLLFGKFENQVVERL